MPTTTFVWDPVNDCVISELDGTGTTKAVYTNEPQQYGGVLSQRRGSTSSFLHADALGTTRLLTSTAGATTDTYLLDAWGNPVSSTGSTINPFRWVGRYGYYTDSVTGLLYVRARMYMPVVARWCSVDPDEENIIFLYLYSKLNPSNFGDPSGLVDLKLDPTAAESMPWYSKKLAGSNEVGQTKVQHSGSWKVQQNSETKKCRCRFTLEGTAKIYLDIEKTRLLSQRSKNKKLTLQNNYGHEQRHVENFIKIMEWGADELEKVEAMEFDTAAEAQKECKKELERVSKEIKEKIEADARHRGINPKSPRAGAYKDYEPIGEMPAEPAREAETSENGIRE